MNEYKFQAGEARSYIVDWIKCYFAKNGNADTKAIIGISGGKDSSVVAALCTQALGPQRVLGVLMPQHKQEDIEDSRRLCDFLKIESITIDIGPTVDTLYKVIDDMVDCQLNDRVYTNTPARIRMATLYAIAALYGGRVANTCNMSEDYVGYSTKYGDSAGDFAPLMNYTVTEVLAIGEALGLPHDLIYKTPSDGMCGQPDEVMLGFPYRGLDEMLRKGICPAGLPVHNIIERHDRNIHKLKHIPAPIFKGKSANITFATQDATSMFLTNSWEY